MTAVYLILFLYTAVCLHLSDNRDHDYLDRETTTAIKGFFAVFVFVRHFLEYTPGISSTAFQSIGLLINRGAGQLIVAMYLFYSGYGIWEAARYRGERYIKSIPVQKAAKTLLRFDVAVTAYLITQLLQRPGKLTFQRVLLSFLGLESLGNSCWYIFCILMMYLIAWIALSCFGADHRGVIAVWCISALYIVIMMMTRHHHIWYDTAWCFALGCSWSHWKEHLHRRLNTHSRMPMLLSAMLFILFYGMCYVKPIYKNLCYPIASVCFCLVFVQLTRYIRLQSKVLYWFGMHLFPIYIYQRLPMIWLRSVKGIKSRPYLYFALCLLATLLIAQAEQRLWNYFARRKKKMTNQL